MCGIGGIYVKDASVGSFPVEDFADLLMMGLQSRGRDATGIVSIDKAGAIHFEKQDIQANDFVLRRKPQPENTKVALVHTRAATQGDCKNPRNNHPVQYGSCYATHNGHISNDGAVFKDLDLERKAEVDSEAIVACLSKSGLSDTDEFKKALETLRGTFAIAAIDPIAHPGKLLLAKGPSSPLYILNHRKAIIWASTKKAIEDAWSICLGTPPKNSFWGSKREETPQHGFHSLREGEFWLIDNDLIKPGTFESFQYPRYQGGTDWSESYWEGRNPNYRSRSVGGEVRLYTASLTEQAEAIAKAEGFHRVVAITRYGSNETLHFWRKFYCDPDADTCALACRAGCKTLGCSCYIEERREEEAQRSLITYDCSPSQYNCDHKCEAGCLGTGCVCFDVADDDDLPENFEEGEGCETLDFSTAQVKCESCWDWFPPSELEDDYVSYFGALCTNCAEAVKPKEERHLRLVDTEPNTVIEDEADGHKQQLMESYEEAHNKTCKAIADKFNCSQAYVEWVLFEKTLEDDDNSGLKDDRDHFDAAYSEIYQRMLN